MKYRVLRAYTPGDRNKISTFVISVVKHRCTRDTHLGARVLRIVIQDALNYSIVVLDEIFMIWSEEEGDSLQERTENYYNYVAA